MIGTTFCMIYLVISNFFSAVNMSNSCKLARSVLLSIISKDFHSAMLPARDFSLGPTRSKITIFWCFVLYVNPIIDQACSVKLAGYWPRSFFACLWTSTWSRSINKQKENLANIQPSSPHTSSITHLYLQVSLAIGTLS